MFNVKAWGLAKLSALILATFLVSQSSSLSQTLIEPGFPEKRVDFLSPSAISADGSTALITGENSYARYFAGSEGFLWKPAVGYEVIFQQDEPSFLTDLSADGSVIVGNTTIGGRISPPRSTAFRWTRDTGRESLGSLPDAPLFYPTSRVTAVSDDGRTSVGGSSSSRGFEAFRWTQETGMRGLGFLDTDPPRPTSFATNISGDGRVIVGYSTLRGDLRAFRWTREAGMLALEHPPGQIYEHSIPEDVSTDGSVVVGYMWKYPPGGPRFAFRDIEAFRWTETNGIEPIGHLPGGGGFSVASAVSGDGRVVVGTSDSDREFQEAFVWTPVEGMVSLEDKLATAGVEMGEIQLVGVVGISEDGEVILGEMIADASQEYSREPFIATLTTDRAIGLLGLDDLVSSVEGISEMSGSSAALSLRGAGDLMFSANTFRAEPSTVDVTSLDWTGFASDVSFKAFALGQGLSGFSEDSQAASGAIGLMGGNYDLGLSAGLALQGQHVTQTGGENDSEASSNGIGPAAFIRYAPGESGISLTATANYSFLNADIDRRYTNGATVETAMGDTDGYSVGGEAQVGWRFGLGSDVTVMPYAAYQIQHAELDAYDETGATFAGRMSEQETTIRKAKLGALGAWQVHPSVSLTGSIEFAHVDEDVSNAGLNVAALGTGTFGGTGGSRDYALATIGFGASYAVNDRVTVFGGVDVTKALNSEADDQDVVGARLGVAIDLF